MGQSAAMERDWNKEVCAQKDGQSGVGHGQEYKNQCVHSWEVKWWTEAMRSGRQRTSKCVVALSVCVYVCTRTCVHVCVCVIVPHLKENGDWVFTPSKRWDWLPAMLELWGSSGWGVMTQTCATLYFGF